uniref:SEC22 homolog B, vesicle trafficking protein a n=1 Tax=Seriola dumerili TaxID=41447 RepID=A0A3B4U7B3_SERDU
MILLTMIARVADGLPLSASIQEEEQSRRDLQQYQSQAKQLCRKLNAQSPDRCTLEAGDVNFHYLIAQGICYLSLCEASFPKKMAFAYLENLHNEFYDQYGRKVPRVTRPYSFIEFDTYIQKTKKTYVDSRGRRNLGNINTELQDVQRIMVANIEEVLQRGEALSGKYRIVLECLGIVLLHHFSKLNVHLLIQRRPDSSVCILSLSSRHKSQQSVYLVEEVPQRCKIPQHSLHVCQGGRCDSVLPHTHHLCALLVALMDSRTKTLILRRGGPSLKTNHLNRSRYISIIYQGALKGSYSVSMSGVHVLSMLFFQL